MDVFFFEAFLEEADMIKRYLPSGIKAGFTDKTIQEYKGVPISAKVISMRTQSVIEPIWSEKTNGILTRSSGFDHIQRYLKKFPKIVPAGYLPLYCSRAVAEQALMLWMALLRKLPSQLKSFCNFNRDNLTGRECKGKTLLVVGVGNIGYEIADVGTGLGMNVLGVDIVKKHADINYVEIDEGISKSDVIVCSMNLTDDNAAYFNYERLKKAKKNTIFVNIARGELSPSGDIAALLKDGFLGGVGMDVYNNECELAVSLRSGKSSQDSEVKATLDLLKHPNTLLTPHNAFNTYESVTRKAEQSCRQISQFLDNGTFLWPIPV